MKVSEFINQCVDRGCAWQKGSHDGNPGYYVRCDRFKTVAHFTPQAVLSNEFNTLWNHVVQERDVKHMTRVVGYYSRIENWNNSKRGELKARQAGNYRLK